MAPLQLHCVSPQLIKWSRDLHKYFVLKSSGLVGYLLYSILWVLLYIKVPFHKESSDPKNSQNYKSSTSETKVLEFTEVLWIMIFPTGKTVATKAALQLCPDHKHNISLVWSRIKAFYEAKSGDQGIIVMVKHLIPVASTDCIEALYMYNNVWIF